MLLLGPCSQALRELRDAASRGLQEDRGTHGQARGENLGIFPFASSQLGSGYQSRGKWSSGFACWTGAVVD